MRGQCWREWLRMSSSGNGVLLSKAKYQIVAMFAACEDCNAALTLKGYVRTLR